jgi:RNase P/RNase MRP subunit POP5
MVVKQKAGRRRYVLVACGDATRQHLRESIRRRLPDARLVFFDGSHAIVRVPHAEENVARQRLNDLTVGETGIVTLRTSGTIKTLKEAIGRRP